MNTHRSDPAALVLMAFAVVVWGFSWVVMKYMMDWIGPFNLVFWRSLVAFCVLLVLQLSVGQRFEVPPLGPSLLVALLQTTLFQCLGQLALTMGGAGQVVLLAYTMPFWAAAIAWPVLGERLSRLHLASFILAAVGLVLVIAPWKGMGNVLALIPGLAAGLCWGGGVVASKKLFQERPPAMLNFITWQMLLGSLFCLPLLLFVPQRPTVWSVESIMGMAYMAVLASALGWWLWLSVVRRVSVAVVGMSSLGVPVLAVILAWLLLDEQPDAATLVGVAAIISGLVVVNLAALRSVKH
ncbi:DMT family transporter [Achromobacter sp. F4_2707]|uniref:DMT family transporter n=1 Tax=Achromobacter sp. F4_2707 TaxID=3114286 RepID=UPI0039C75706